MTRILDSKEFQSQSTNPPIKFIHSGLHKSAGLFTRYITLEDNLAYRLSFSCGTCQFIFERLDGANRTVSVQEINETLQNSLKSIDSQLLQLIMPIIPRGDYLVNLLEVRPKLVTPFSSKDYFSKEQVALWGVNTFLGLPEYPQTEYYRSHTQKVGNKQALFEFIVPMIPKTWLNKKTVENYIKTIRGGLRPTASAIAILDVKQPANWKGNPTINEHWCLAHFLLDGHHKMFAASKTQKPITLLSFLAISECICTAEEIKRVEQILSITK